MSLYDFFQRISPFCHVLKKGLWVTLLILSPSAFTVTGQKNSQPIEVKIENETKARARITQADVSRMVASSKAMLDAPGGYSPEIGLAGSKDSSSQPRFLPDVSSGTVRYEVPIAVPMGVAGQKPQLALVYESRASNDIAGVGWKLNIPSIERSLTPKLDYASTDFSLVEGHSSSFLIKTLNTADYESYEPRFQGSFDALRRFTDPSKNLWQLRQKNGLVETFGDSENSRINVGGRTFSWLLSSVTDTYGNSILYGYRELGGEKYINLIAYGASSNRQSIPATCAEAVEFQGCVEFNWSPRNDTEITYERGGMTKRAYRLGSIKLYSAGVIFDQYILGYDFGGTAGAYSPSSGRSLLTSVKHTGRGTVETAETVAAFSYNSTPSQWRRELWASEPRRPYPFMRLHGDFNGDARTDFAFINEDGAYRWLMYLSDGQRWKNGGTPESWAPGPKLRFWSTIFNGPEDPSLFMPIPWAGLTADFSGDGRSDLVYAAPNNNCLPNPPPVPGNQVGFCNPYNWVMFTAGETSGWKLNGWDHWSHGPRMSVHDVLQHNASWDFYSFTSLCHAGRFYDDARAGFACFDENGRQWQVAIANNLDWNNKDWVTETWSGPTPKPNEEPRRWMERCHFADFDGDHYTDVACQDRDNARLWHVGLLRGRSWAVSDWSIDSGVDVGHACVSGDINKDGLADIACQQTPDNGKWVSFLSTATGWANANVFDGPAHRDIRFCSSGDINGDERADVFCVTDREGVFELALSRGYYLDSRSVWEVGAEPGSTLIDKMCSFGDFTGDGTIDSACVPNDLGKFYISRAVNPFPDSLVEVTDRLGAKLSLHYTTSANFNNQVLPMPVKVVDSWTIQNSKTAPPIKADIEYKDGYYNIKDRELLGFGYSKVVEGNKISESWFGEAGGTPTLRNRGKLRKSRLSTPAERFETDYEYFSSADSSAPFFDPVKFIKQTHYDCTNISTCGAGIIRAHRFFEYDSRGNVTASFDLRAGESESLLTTADFTPLDEGSWLVGFKKSESSFSLKNSAAISESHIQAQAAAKPRTYLTELTPLPESTVITSSRYTYDTSNSCNQSPTKTASITEIQNLVNANEWTRSFYGYDKWGNLACKADANGALTKMSYGTNGVNLESITAPNGLTTNFTHFTAADTSVGSGMPGQLKSVNISNQNQTKFEYERYGRLASLQSSGGRAETYFYTDTPADMVSRVRVEDAKGSVSETTYDAAGLPLQIRKNAPEGKWIVTAITRDKYSNELSETLPTFENETPKSISYKRDDLGRLRSIIYPSGDKNTICYYGNTVQTLDANGRLRSYNLNNRGSLISLFDSSVKQTSCESPLEARSVGTKLTVTRDAIERPVQMDDSGGVRWRIAYDGVGRIGELYDAGLPPARFSYDSIGNLKTGVNADGSSVSFEYNSANQVISKTQTVKGKTFVTTLEYDPNGRLTSVMNPGNVTRFNYDANGRLTGLARKTKRFWWFKWKPELSMTYDNVGRPSTVEYPDGRTYTYKFDAGMLTAISADDLSNPLVRFSDFDAYGRWKTKSLSSGIVESRTFDARGWLKSSTVALNDKRLSSLEYEYDSVGNPKRIIFNGKEQTAEYDAKDRLIHFKDGSEKSLDYSYNASGSLLYAGEVGSYVYPDSPDNPTHAHSPISVAQEQVNHDASGRVTSIGDRRFEYDANGQLTAVRNRKRKLKIKYDGLGNFARIEGGGLRSNYFFSDFYACLSGKCSSALMGDTGVLAQVDKKGRPLFFHRDLLGSVIAVTDESGDLVWNGSYLPFGRSKNQDEKSPSVFDTFAYGRKFPKEDSILKLGARIYDTQTNMFLQPDPLSPTQADPDNLNRYAYANNNPLRFVDPDGLQAGTVTYNMPSYNFGGNIGFDVNIFSTPAFNQNLFNQDLQKFYEQLNRLNADRFKEFVNDPSKFSSNERPAASVFGLPRITGGDYQKGSLRVPPFAAIPTTELIENIRTMKPWGTSVAGTLLFAWKVSPRNDLLFNTLGEGVWDYKAGTGNVRNLEKIIAENAGNFNFGAVGAAMGFSLETLLSTGGGVNAMTGVFRSSYREGYSQGIYGRAFITAPYGDDQIDQYWIMRGYQYYKTNAAEIDWIINAR